MRARWTCAVCDATFVSLSARALRDKQARHEVSCGSSACLAWHEDMRATRLAVSLIDPESAGSSVPFMVDLRHKLHA